ncbi:MAG TPA: type III-B CRISPR module RAMP protein Cmr6 [Anaerolineae bacterium]|nr:type III-B CRISPR module RAMP protein Cmr6 [Anaerolineae bacterium]
MSVERRTRRHQGREHAQRTARLVYPLPSDTALAFASFARQCRNPGLVFARYVGYWDNWALDPRKLGRETKNPKFENLRTVQDMSIDDDLRGAFVKRWQSTVSSAGAETFSAASEWRFVIGLGGGGPLEVGFTFHRIYGFPIIPGSGLKGLTRNYALQMADEVQGETLDERERDPLFTLVFGQRDGAGSAVFFDGVPKSRPSLEVDVMNPHYPDYYQGGQPPGDGQHPIPIFFLTVGPGSEFLFAVGGRGTSGGEAKHQAVKWLKAALAELGVGAKTSAGYGYFALQTG